MPTSEIADERLRLLRYGLIGTLATAVHYAVLLVLVELTASGATLATATGSVAGAAAAYAGNRRFTFAADASHLRALPRFALVAAACAGVNASVVWIGSEFLRLHYLVPQLGATALVLGAGFVIHRAWTFG